MAAHAYLVALSKLFEDGFLCSRRVGLSKIDNLQSPTLRNIQEGYQFFINWWTQLNNECKHLFTTIVTRCLRFDK